MDAYDIFVLVVAAVVFYFLYRIFAPLIRGLIMIFKSAKGAVDKHRVRKEQAHASEEQAEPEEAGVVYEDPAAVEKLLSSPPIQRDFAALLLHYNGKIWEYLSENFDVAGKDAHRKLIELALLVQITEKYDLANNDAVIQAICGRICEQDESQRESTLRFAWPSIWKVFMEYKPTETEPGQAASALMVRVISTVSGPGTHDELWEFVGTVLRCLEDQCDEVWASE